MKESGKRQIHYYSTFIMFLLMPIILYNYDLTVFIFAPIIAYFSATMDISADKFDNSIYYDRDRNFYEKKSSWPNKYVLENNIIKGRKKWFGIITIPVFFLDFWHRQKAKLIATFCLAFIVLLRSEPVCFWAIEYTIILLSYWLTFEFYYSFLLHIKDNEKQGHAK